MLMLAVFSSGCADSEEAVVEEGEEMNEEKAGVIEVITFYTKEGVTDEEFLNLDSNVEIEHVSKQPGYISRETAKNEDGEWLIVVHWETLADADASISTFESAPAAAPFVDVIDTSTMAMKRYSIAQ